MLVLGGIALFYVRNRLVPGKCRDRLVPGGIACVVDQVLCNKFLQDPELCVAALYSCAWRHTCHHSVSFRTVCGADERCDFGACLARCPVASDSCKGAVDAIQEHCTQVYGGE